MTGLQDDLKTVLRKIESELLGRGYGWKNVLYIHLYLADMDDFALANETYVSFITQEKCPFGVPSRSTIELPLLQVRSGNAYIEVLVANDQSKRVLHVQSISSWAPSCIGPYSQVKVSWVPSWLFSCPCYHCLSTNFQNFILRRWYVPTYARKGKVGKG